ncbi:MAG: AraC family transcriptional regulator [Chloroflexi bacterium]|nr:AraC family transcriptional regulator [Chloroflexota bacterium]
MKQCIACGMPMPNKEDYAMGDETKAYCRHCMKPDGTMQSYDEKVASLTQFVIKTQGFAEEAARQSVKAMLAKLPAWKDLQMEETHE